MGGRFEPRAASERACDFAEASDAAFLLWRRLGG
jgi:hypothetical protein